MVIELGLKEV